MHRKGSHSNDDLHEACVQMHEASWLTLRLYLAYQHLLLHLSHLMWWWKGRVDSNPETTSACQDSQGESALKQRKVGCCSLQHYVRCELSNVASVNFLSSFKGSRE